MFSQYESKYGFVTTNGPELNNVKNETEILRDGRKSAGFNMRRQSNQSYITVEMHENNAYEVCCQLARAQYNIFFSEQFTIQREI